MNKISMIVLVLVLLVGGFFIMQGDDSKDSMQKDYMEGEDVMMEKDVDAMMEEDKIMKEDDGSMMEAEGEMMSKAGSYETYSSEKLALADKGDVVLFFRASWCPSCKTVDSDIRVNLESIPSNLSILDVDYDNSTELKKKYGVTYQHTFVQVDSSGKLLKKWSASPTLEAIVNQVI